MTQGMFAAVSGVRANLTRLNVISNNIANLNTIGFKSSSVNFGTVFSQTLFGGTRPTSALGGVNPRQVGVGTQVVDITTNFSQGGAQFTGRNSDLYINGNGFFVIQKADPSSTQASGFVLTRAGNFNLDSSGNLITAPDGFKLQGTSQLVGTSPLNITQVNIPPELTVVKHLNASGQIVGTNIGIVPSNSALLTGPITTAAGQIGAGSVTQNRQVVKLQSFTVGSDGAINATYSNGDRITVRTNATTLATATAAGDPTLTRREIVHLPAEGGNFPMLDFQTGDNNFGTVGAPPAAGVAAAGLCSLLSVAGVTPFSASTGGDARQGMQIQLQSATVTNVNGLLSDSANAYVVGANSGSTFFGIPSTENRGTLQAGALEGSNVDLAGEFSSMIITQRGLEASSKVIRTNDEVLQSIINIL